MISPPSFKKTKNLRREEKCLSMELEEKILAQLVLYSSMVCLVTSLGTKLPKVFSNQWIK